MTGCFQHSNIEPLYYQQIASLSTHGIKIFTVIFRVFIYKMLGFVKNLYHAIDSDFFYKFKAN